MGEVLELRPKGQVKPKEYVNNWEIIDYGAVASIFMDEIHKDFAFLIRSKLLEHNIQPTERTVKCFCEAVSAMMGDMDVDEILKEVKRQHKGVILD